jgi:mRNA export factor
MTAGSDGCMHFWDYDAKNKIKTLSYAGNPICTARVSPNGDMVAYGLGNDWHMGKDGLNKWEVKIGVHHIT